MRGTLLGLTVVLTILAGCATDPTREEIEAAELDLEWEQAPNLTEVGIEEVFVATVERRDVPEGGVIASQLVASQDWRERPSPNGNRLDCRRIVDLWHGDRASAVCSFEEPGTWYVRGHWDKRWEGPRAPDVGLEAWSQPAKVRVLPGMQLDTLGDPPGFYDPAEPVNVSVAVDASPAIEGEVAIAYGPSGQVSARNLSTFDHRCPAEPFEGDTEVNITCDWSEGGSKEWLVFLRVSEGDDVFTRPMGARSGWVTVYQAEEEPRIE